MSVVLRSLGRGVGGGVGVAQLKFGPCVCSTVLFQDRGEILHVAAAAPATATVGVRGVSTSSALLGKRNLRKFHLGNKRGTRLFRKARNLGELPDMPVETQVRSVGFKYGIGNKNFTKDEFGYGSRFHIIPEMVPEFIVPDLKDCKLLPYVSYRAGDTYQEALTPEDLWQHVYFNKFDQDFKEGHLDEDGNPKVPSPQEGMTPDEAWTLARQTGSDIFSERIPRQWECLEIDLEQWKKERLAKTGFEHFTDVMKEPYSPEMLLEENKDEEEDQQGGDKSTPTRSANPVKRVIAGIDRY